MEDSEIKRRPGLQLLGVAAVQLGAEQRGIASPAEDAGGRCIRIKAGRTIIGEVKRCDWPSVAERISAET